MITEKTLEIVNITGPSTFLPIPVADIPAGRDIKIHVVGQNTLPTSQKLGINWQVWDPAYNLVQEYGPVFEAFTTPPGDAHTFMGPFFSINEQGTYQVYIYLWAEVPGGNPQLLDNYIGDLGVVGTPQSSGWVPLLTLLVSTSVSVLETTGGWLPMLSSLVSASVAPVITTGGWLPMFNQLVTATVRVKTVTPPPDGGVNVGAIIGIAAGVAGVAVIAASAVKKRKAKT